jgi:hypothetical protein
MKKKKGNKDITLRTVEVGQFVIRVALSKVEIETTSKNWKHVYKEGSAAYNVISSLVDSSSVDSLRTLVLALYTTTMFFIDAGFVKDFLDLIQKHQLINMDKPLSEEEDQVILEEEKRLHENKEEDKDGEDALEKE